ncbi:MAG: amidohydrolase, partial [bacterium]
FELLKKRQGASQIVAGMDDPYPLGEMDSVPDSYPGKVIDEALKTGIINRREFELIWQGNVEKWLGREETE